MRFSRGGRKLPWITGELSCLKNEEMKVAKRSKVSEQLREEFLTLREEQMHGWAYDNDRVGIEEVIKSDSKTFLVMWENLKKKCVGYPSVMHFEGRMASSPDDICNLFLYNEQLLMMYGCLLIPDQISCRMTHVLLLFSSL
jgi:hypothetical protein